MKLGSNTEVSRNWLCRTEVYILSFLAGFTTRRSASRRSAVMRNKLKSKVKKISIGVFSPYPLLLTGLGSALRERWDSVALHSERDLDVSVASSFAHVVVDGKALDPGWSQLPVFLNTETCTLMVDTSTLQGSLQFLASSRVNIVSKNNLPDVIVSSVASGLAGRRFVASDVGYALRKKPARNTTHAALSKRESEIVVYIANGSPNKYIAAELGVSVNTIKFYVTVVMQKLHVKNRVELARWAICNGMSRPIDSRT